LIKVLSKENVGVIPDILVKEISAEKPIQQMKDRRLQVSGYRVDARGIGAGLW
jgi:hypothetical protein